MSKIVTLRQSAPPFNGSPDEQIIERLETALAAAKSGELRSFALVGQLTGGRWLETWKYEYNGGRTIIGMPINLINNIDT
ncbi:MAG: hypothetical protein ACR2KT_11545 [Methylocella sp.]